MTRDEAFIFMLVTLFMAVSGCREMRFGRYAMAAALFGVPACAWLSLLWKP